MLVLVLVWCSLTQLLGFLVFWLLVVLVAQVLRCLCLCCHLLLLLRLPLPRTSECNAINCRDLYCLSLTVHCLSLIL